MKLTRDRLHSIGWVAVLTVCAALTLGLTLRVNAVKSQVRLAERQIVALRLQKTMLETEFETRANQQQLKAMNDVDFGYQAPTAGQYLEGERQLAVLAKPRAPDAPTPIRVASAAGAQPKGFPALVSPLSGKAIAAELAPETAMAPRRKAAAVTAAASGADRLTRLDHVEVRAQ